MEGRPEIAPPMTKFRQEADQRKDKITSLPAREPELENANAADQAGDEF